MSAHDSTAYYWAKALFAAAKKHDEIGQADLDLHIVLGAVQSDASAGIFFNNPAISAEDKEKIIEHALKSRSAKGLLGIMFARHHFGLLGMVARKYRAMVKEARRERDVEVRLPQIPSQESLKAMKENICAILGCNVNMKFAHDPSLIGGVWMKIGSTVYDGTFRKDLELIKERLSAQPA